VAPVCLCVCVLVPDFCRLEGQIGINIWVFGCNINGDNRLQALEIRQFSVVDQPSNSNALRRPVFILFILFRPNKITSSSLKVKEMLIEWIVIKNTWIISDNFMDRVQRCHYILYCRKQRAWIVEFIALNGQKGPVTWPTSMFLFLVRRKIWIHQKFNTQRATRLMHLGRHW
jgi:hypothetical protein